MNFSKKLQQKIDKREANNALRQLGKKTSLIDFASNDYLGLAKSETVFKNTHDYLLGHNITQNGATGSRLLTGNHALYNVIETVLCEFHNSEAALIFNSGYDANIGFFSSVPQRGDIILYDEYIHVSIRDGISMSNAKAYKFKHNNLADFEEKILRFALNDNDIYIVTESVFSMDGDSPDLVAISEISKKNNAFLIVDEAHAVGVFGKKGVGIIQALGIENNVFARLVTFGKALGCHGAAILGNNDLKQYLVNFARSFIYTTALSPHAIATIISVYNELTTTQTIEKLHQNIVYFKEEVIKNNLQFKISPFGEMSVGQRGFIKSDSAIQSYLISGNEKVKLIALQLQQNGFDVKPILSPTVPENQERLRFCLHTFNTKEEITNVLHVLKETINKFPFPLERD